MSKTNLGKKTLISVVADGLDSIELYVSRFSENPGKEPVKKQFLGHMNQFNIYDTTWDLSGSMSFSDNPEDAGRFITWFKDVVLKQSLDQEYPDITLTVTDMFGSGAKRVTEYYDCGFGGHAFDRDPETPKEPTINWYANDFGVIRKQ
jgi:hypothetical protein